MLTNQACPYVPGPLLSIEGYTGKRHRQRISTLTTHRYSCCMVPQTRLLIFGSPSCTLQSSRCGARVRFRSVEGAPHAFHLEPLGGRGDLGLCAHDLAAARARCSLSKGFEAIASLLSANCHPLCDLSGSQRFLAFSKSIAAFIKLLGEMLRQKL